MSIICEEVFDEISHPSLEEVHDYAKKIGIDPDSEPQLLPLAAEGLMKALPPGWRPCYDEASKSYYYHNNSTGKTQWEHPLDDIYRGLVKKARTESQSLSLGEPTEDATYIRDELPSFEEPPINLGARKKDTRLSPIKAKPLDTKLPKQKSEERPPSSTGKISLKIFSSFDNKRDLDKFQSLEKNELKVTGGGSIFLKSNSKKGPDLSSSPTQKSFLSPDGQNQPRSILRDRSLIEPSRSMEFDKSIEKSDRDDDDKKSVRFNLENNTDVAFTFSDKSSSDDDINEKDVLDEIINVKLTNMKRSRFTVSPVTEDKFKYDSITNLKLIKPNPTDFLKPKLKISKSSDSEDDSVLKLFEKKEKLLKGEIAESDNSSHDEDDGKQASLKEMEEEISEKSERKLEKLRNTIWEEKNDELQKFKDDLQESHKKELERILITEKTKFEEDIKKELENLRLEMENRTTGTLKEEKIKLEAALENHKNELEKLYENEHLKLEQHMREQFEIKKELLEKQHEKKLQGIEITLAEKLEKSREDLIVSHNSIIDQLKQNHSIILEELKKDFISEEQMIRKEHQVQMSELKNKMASEIESEKSKKQDSSTDERMYEKIRCEKRLLEDKYRCLKDKYLRLKTDVKLSIEKRNRKREQSGTATTTGSETERSHSINKERTPMHSPSSHRKNLDKPPTPKHFRSENRTKPEHRTTRQIIIQDMDTSASDRSYKNEDKINKNDDSSDGNVNPGRSRKKIFSRLKSSSTSRINNNSKPRKSQRSCSPVENLRRQLQKLEDLEDQFPQNPQADTYHLRYPFTDEKKFEGSSELEFFRHRIHLERDSIKRAKESLRSQKSLFQQRQKELKLKHGSMARHTLQQLCQEEKELTDMEVSLHRTRSLLGEKVIRLRHLEQSLYRASLTNDQNKQDDTTLSDLSSHSASSGISSTEFATADGNGKAVIRGENFQESSEIIQSLENLNSEIREIWEVLHKQHQQSGNVAAVMPPLPFVYPDLGWPVLAGTAALPAPPSIPTLADRLHNYRQHVALANAQSTVVTHANQGATTTLVERTRNLRHWLRQAGIDNTNESASPQATL